MTVSCKDELPFYVNSDVIGRKRQLCIIALCTLIINLVLSAQVKEHAIMKTGQVIKFSSSLHKNSAME